MKLQSAHCLFYERVKAESTRSGSVANALKVSATLHDFWSKALGLDIDRDEFAARLLFRWQRMDTIVAGITIETGALAFIIEAAAGLKLTHDQRAHLIERIEIGNKVLIEHAEKKMEWA